ncbi:MAG: TIGR01906 family membrane protein [Clostridiales bacterium]|nr:TIGR01906 family membrane protein [Clostridiales bacterium]
MYYKKIIHIFTGIFLSALLLFTSLEIVSFNINHYMNQYKNLEISRNTGIDLINLKYITEELLLYLKDDRNDLIIFAEIDGSNREVFGEREKEHMVDVKDLFIKGRYIRNISLIIFPIMLWMIKDKKGRINLASIFIYTCIINIILITILFLLMYTNFNKYFNYFHYIFFDNDLWILNPDTDIMINIFPETFFYNTAIKISFIYISSLIILAIMGFIYKRKTV